MCRSPALEMLMRAYITLLLLISGCKTQGGLQLPFDLPAATPPNTQNALILDSLSPFRWAGALCMLSGALLLFISQGSKGWIPLLTGAGLVLLNTLLAHTLSSTYTIWLIVGTVIVALLILGLDLQEFKKCLRYRSLMRLRRSSLSSYLSSPEHGSDEQSSPSSEA